MDLLIRNAHRDQWRETVIMAAGHANEPLRRELLTGVLDRAKTEPHRARRLKLLAVACLETLPSVPDGLREALDRCLDELVPPRDIVSARSLATAGEPVLARLPKSLAGLSEAAAKATVRTAWLINGPEALNVLARYGSDSRPKVQQELGQAWNYFDPREYAERVLSSFPPGGILGIVKSPRQLAELDKVPPLHFLTVYLNKATNFDFLDTHTESLRTLWLQSNYPSTIPTSLPPLPSLRSITLTLPGLTDLNILNVLPSLEIILIHYCDNIINFTPLKRQTSLTGLHLYDAHGLTNLKMLPPLDGLRSLALAGSNLTCELAGVVAAAPQLETLHIRGCGWIDDVSTLGDLTLLSYLDLSQTSLRDLTPLTRLTNLETLWLYNCAQITDLRPLASLPKLKKLYVQGIAPGTDLSPLADNRRLTVRIRPGQEVRGGKALGRRLKLSL